MSLENSNSVNPKHPKLVVIVISDPAALPVMLLRALGE
jgi:hypothetical protein